MPLPTPTELDRHASRALHEAKLTLQRAFAEGLATVHDFSLTTQALKEVSDIIDSEQAVETSRAIREKMEERTMVHEKPSPSSKHIAVFLDGSSTSYSALRWTVHHIMRPQDVLFLVNIMPFEDFKDDAERILQQGYEFAHNAGVKASKLHVKALTAQKSSSTGGVGESVKHFAEDSRIDLVVLGSRGMGSVKGSLLGAVGMGSVSGFCVQNLLCPVMVVREQDQLDAVGRNTGNREPLGEAEPISSADVVTA